MHNKNSEAKLNKHYSPNPMTKNYTEVFWIWKGKIIVLIFIWKNMFLTVNVKESQQKIYEKSRHKESSTGIPVWQSNMEYSS